MIEIPCIIWGSDKFKQMHPEKWQAIIAAVNQPYMTDDMINTILDLTDIQTAEYDETRSIVSKRFNAARPRIFDDKDYDREILTGNVQE